MPLKKLMRLIFWGRSKGDPEVQRLLVQLEKAKLSASEPTLRFKRSWAHGNAGLEDESITKEQVEAAVK
jgi:hypothetical protein